LYSSFRDTGPATALYDELAVGMADGTVALVVKDQLVTTLIADNETTTQLFESNYCRVSDPETRQDFAQTNTTLFEFAPDCPEHRRPQVDAG
jgi:hypothetical protein